MKLLFLFSFLILISCNNKTENDLQGQWSITANASESTATDQIWTFNQGNFTLKGSPSLDQKGDYSIIQSFEDMLVVKLKNQDGTLGSEDKTIRVKFNADNTVVIDDQGTFARLPSN